MSQTPVLAAERVSFKYPGSTGLVVEDWDAQFFPGSVTALTGASGCGKSTRLYLLALMLRLTSGRILLDGERVDARSEAERSRLRADRFGFVFQDAALDTTRTVRSNVLESMLYRGQDPARFEALAQSLLEQMGVDVPLDRRPGQISGGQAQRIAICRALVGNPDIVFADEPTGNLDPDSSRVVQSILRQKADAGASVIVVTHDPVVAAWATSE